MNIFSAINACSHSNFAKSISSYVLVALIGHLFFGYGVQAPYVLCFGQNGHVAVERAGHDHARDALAQSGNVQDSHQAAALADADQRYLQGLDKSKPCLDLPIGDESQSSHYSLEPLLQHLLDAGWAMMTIVILLIVTLQPTFLKHHQLFTTNPNSSSPALRRCVVLLI